MSTIMRSIRWGFAHLAQPARVILIDVRLQQPAPARLAVSRMPDLEILVRRAESVEALILPVAAAYLECRSHHRTVIKAVDHFAFVRRPLRRDRDVPQDPEGNGADRGFGFHVILQARLPVRDADPVFAALDVLNGAPIADRVAQFRREGPRELVVAALDLCQGLGVMAVRIADEVQRCVVLKPEQHVVDCVRGRAPLAQEIAHADVGEPRDLRRPILADAVADLPHGFAVIMFVEVREADLSLFRGEIQRHLRHIHRLPHRHFHALVLQQRDFRQVLWEKGLQFEAEVFHPLQRNAVSIGNASGAGLGVKVVGKSLADGVHPSAGMKLRLQNDDVVPGILQLPSCRQPSQSRAQDHDTLAVCPRLR